MTLVSSYTIPHVQGMPLTRPLTSPVAAHVVGPAGKVVGIDPTALVVEAARRIDITSIVEWRNWEGVRLPFDDESFEIVHYGIAAGPEPPPQRSPSLQAKPTHDSTLAPDLKPIRQRIR